MRAAFGLLSVLLLAPACADSNGENSKLREWDGERLHSTISPVADFFAAESFDYLGNFVFVLRDTSTVDRHVWAETTDGRIDSLLIVQFERFLPAVDGTFGFGIPPQGGQSGGDFKFSPEEVSFGDAAYVHNTWALNHEDNAAANPEAESAATLAFLEGHGLSLDAEVIMSRAVRVASDDARAELILFYIEPLAARGAELASFDPEGPMTEAYELLSDTVTARHLEVFRVEAN